MDHALSRRGMLSRLGAAGALLAIGPDIASADDAPHAGLAAPKDWNTAWWAPAPDAIPAMADIALERLVARGTIVLVCDFALGHLATRLAKGADVAPGTTATDVHAALRAGLVPGGVLVPSGIFGLGAAQNAGCAFVPA